MDDTMDIDPSWEHNRESVAPSMPGDGPNKGGSHSRTTGGSVQEGILEEAFSRARGGSDPHALARETVETLKKQAALSGSEKDIRQTLAGYFYEAARGVGAFRGATTDEEFVRAARKAAEKVAKRIVPPASPQRGGGHGFCFPADTLITMADGSEKPIEIVRADDVVYSCDEQTKEFSTAVVRGIYSARARELFRLNDGLLKVTGSHSIYTQKHNGNEGWAVLDPAIALQKGKLLLQTGDRVFTRERGWAPIETIEKLREELGGEIDVFNLEHVEPAHTFCAGGVLVHNHKKA